MSEGTMTGVKNLHYALEAAVGYATPKKVSDSVKISLAPTIAKGKKSADNAIKLNVTKVIGYSLETELLNFPLDIKAEILGHTFQNGKQVDKTTDRPPYMAVAFEFTKENGATRYVWLYKGRFEEPNEDGQTEDESINFQTPTIKADFIENANNELKFTMDTDQPGYDPVLAANWYNAVQYFTADTTNPTIQTIVPAAGATGIAVGADITVTFSKAMNFNSLNNIILVDNTYTKIACTLSLDETSKILTINPDVNLAAAKLHTVIFNKVVDTAGLPLPYTTKAFTTA